MEHDINYDDEVFIIPLADNESNNQRIAVRYIRTDISASLSMPGWFNFTNHIPVRLLDISSKGSRIVSNRKLALNKKVILHLLFDDSQSFSIKAKIVHLTSSNEKQYGVKFENLHNELGEYLLDSQQDLTFS
ncbi:MAG: PilZ domain-containing protein [Methylococcales bacterium]|nr:PilZ domain-containing protein [Methylococcales bacterium]